MRWRGRGGAPGLPRQLSRGVAVAALLLGGLLPPEGIEAQGWSADLNAARASFGAPPLGALSTNAAVGVRYADGSRTFLTSIAAPLAAGDLYWGVMTAGDRWATRRGRFEAGVDLSGLAHLQRDPSAEVGGSGARGEAIAFVSASIRTVVVEARSGGSLYRGRVGGERWSRDLHLSDLTVTLPLSSAGRERLRVGGELRHLRPGGDEGAYTWAGGSVSGGIGQAGAWFSLGRWVRGLDESSPSTGFGGGASLAVTTRTVVWAQGRREPFDPLFLGSDRTSWGVGASVRLGTPVPPPPPLGAEIRERERVTIRLPLSEAGSPPAVAGDFSGWEPVAMHRRGASWEVTMRIPPGAYRYAFRSGEGDWFVPAGVPGRRDDGMGGWVATLIVPGTQP